MGLYPTTTTKRSWVQAVAQPGISAILAVEEFKRLTEEVATPKPRSQARWAELLQPQARREKPSAGDHHGERLPLLRCSSGKRQNPDHHMERLPLLRCSSGKRQNPDWMAGASPVLIRSLQKSQGERAGTRSTVFESYPPLSQNDWGLKKGSQEKPLIEMDRDKLVSPRNLNKKRKKSRVPQEQVLEDIRQPQEQKVEGQAQNSFLECLVIKHIDHKRKDHVQECETTEPRRAASSYAQHISDKQSQFWKGREIHTASHQQLQTASRHKILPERNPNQQVLAQVEEANQPSIHRGKTSKAPGTLAGQDDSKPYPNINRENHRLWRKLEQLAQDYYTVEAARRQILKQKQRQKEQQWDSVVKGTSMTLLERKHRLHKQCPKEERSMPNTRMCCPLGLNFRLNPM